MTDSKTMVQEKTAFFAYPAQPTAIANTIETAVEKYNSSINNVNLEVWSKNDISGIPIIAPILSKIKQCEYMAADITYLNDNVTFEIGYAIGSSKRVFLFKNLTFEGEVSLAKQVGIFDTLGYLEYENSDDLYKMLQVRSYKPLEIDIDLNRLAPLFIVEPSKRNDDFGVLISRIKKARWRYRSFNPSEDVRLAAMDALRHVGESAGVVAPLLAEGVVKQREHNLRAMFVAGVAIGVGIPTLVLHPADYMPPLDVRDLTQKYKTPEDIRDLVQQFSLDVTEQLQLQEKSVETTKSSILTSLRIGDPTAENEMTTLSEYYLETDEFQRALRGEVNLVVGRKGSGKTALFVQLRDKKRRNRNNVIVDLKPEGYQLIKLKEEVLEYLSAGSQQYLITAFWEYLLLLEITYKVLEKDKSRHLRDHELTDPYTVLEDLFAGDGYVAEGDFSERLGRLSSSLSDQYKYRFREAGKVKIDASLLTEILYKHNIRELYRKLSDYLQKKGEVWLLFDNIDKGWSVEGVEDIDIFVLRCLIDASRKIERDFRRKSIEFRSIVFIRDDVYSLLMEESADYGKDMRASLDWSDSVLLREVLKRRVVNALPDGSGENFDETWFKVVVSHNDGETSMEYMIDRSLMRPRNLIKLFRYSLGYAINLNHTKIEVEDINRGLKIYSVDLLTEVDREITDIFPKAKNLVYEFSNENSEFSHDDLLVLIQCADLNIDEAEKVITFLLYYGVLGVRRGNGDPVYIYNVNYKMELLKVRVKKWSESTKYVINPALWPALTIDTDQLKLV